MKKILYSLSTLALLTFLAGCSKEADNPVGLETEGGLLALIEPDTQTKTNYDSVEGKFVWAEGDQVAIHYNDGSYKTVAVNASTGMLNAPNPTSRDYFAVYPASVADAADYGNSALRITLPDSYDISDVVSGGKSADFSPCPMVASNASSTSKLNFYHVGGLLRVTLKDLPALTQKIRVTFDKDVTGSYEVSNPGTTNPTINTRGESANNVVTFTLAADAIGTYAGEIVLNIPVPCGKYSSIYFEALNTSGATIADKTYNTRPLTFVRHHGKKMSFGEGLEPFVELELNFYEKTAWAGENNLLIAVPYSAGIPITGGTYTVTEELLKGGGEDVLELLPLQQGEAHGAIVLFSSPYNDGVSKKITVTFEKGEVCVSASAIYHVNVITGISFDKAYRQYAWPGHTRTLTAEVKHTGYGDIEGLLSKNPLQVQWSSDKTDLAIPQKSSTATREQNILYAKPNGNPVITPELSISTITARIPENTYGSNHAISASAEFRVVPFTAVPGGFARWQGSPQGSDEVLVVEEIVFARGNVMVTDTFDGTNHSIQWKFADNQWDYSTALPPTTAGQTTTYSHFGWGTGNNPWLTSTNGSVYTSFVDWGIHFDDLGNGSHTRTNGTWKTFSVADWSHLIDCGEHPYDYSGRAYANNLWGYASLYDTASSTSVFGLLLLPDHWVTPSGCTFRAKGMNVYGSAEHYSDGDWRLMEENGALFLPAAGGRSGTGFSQVGSGGFYWSSSPSHDDRAECLFFYSTNLSMARNINICYSVRLSHE